MLTPERAEMLRQVADNARAYRNDSLGRIIHELLDYLQGEKPQPVALSDDELLRDALLRREKAQAEVLDILRSGTWEL